MFLYHTVIRMSDVDAAGILFFPNQFRIVEEAYEALLESVGLPLGKIIAHSTYLMPIVHAESNYYAPLRLGDKITIKLSTPHCGMSSFTLAHEIYRADTPESQLVGAGNTVHVCIDSNTRQKIAVPTEFQNLLQKI